MSRNRNGRHAQVVKVLLKNGPDAKAKTREGRTPSSLAKKKGHNEIVELLHKHGADMERNRPCLRERNEYRQDISGKI